MPNNRFLCPGCEATLRVSLPLPDGNMIRCPKCSSAILLSPEEGDSEQEEKQPRLTNAVNSPAHRSTVVRRPVREVEEREEEEEERPRRRRVRFRPRPKSKRWILLASLLCGGAGLALLIGITAWQVTNYVNTRPLSPKSVSASEATYALRVRTDPEVGKSIREEERSEIHIVTEFHELNGKLLRSTKVDLVQERDLTLSTLALDERGATRFILEFEKAIDQRGVQKTPKSYHGRRLLIEQQNNGTFKANVLGKPDLPPADLEKLAAQVPQDRDRHLVNGVLHNKPMKVNETWLVDTQDFVDAMNLQVVLV